MPKHHDHRGRNGLFGFGLGALSFGAVASAVAGTHKIIETAVQLRHLWDVGEDNMVFVRILERVRFDLREVERLMKVEEVKRALEKTPAKVKWIGETISAVRVALEKTAQFTKKVKQETDHGLWVGLRTRIWFRMEEFEKLQIHTLELARCHDGLLQVLGLLSGIETGVGKPAIAYGRRDERSYDSQHESIGYGQTLREERRDIEYRMPHDDYADDEDIVYTKLGDGPGYSAEIALDRFDGEQLEARYSDARHFSGDQSREQHGEHVTEVEVDRVVERDDGRRVQAHYVEKHEDDHSRHRHHHHHHHHGHEDDDRHIDVERRAEVRRHHGSDHVTKVEIDGYETRDDGHRVEAHYTEEIEDDRRSHRRHDHRGEERYIDVERKAEIRRRS